jgi:hypothetical protein
MDNKITATTNTGNMQNEETATSKAETTEKVITRRLKAVGFYIPPLKCKRRTTSGSLQQQVVCL